jgi:acyl-CoA thioester hydrolase
MTGFPPPVHRVRVRYCETDRMAVAHHGSYVAWFEEARTEWMRARGKTYRQLEDEGNLLQVVEFVCRYHKPVDYDEVIAIAVRVAEAGRAALTLEYECRRQSDGAVCATGSTRLACVGRDGRLRRLPPELSAAGEGPAPAPPADGAR